MPKSDLKHDLAVKDASGTEIGLTLLRDKNGLPFYAEHLDHTLAQQFFTSTPNYANYPAEKEIPLTQDDWRAGFGLQYQDDKEPKRYYYTSGIDARFKGMAMLSPSATSIALAPPTITDGALELWTSATDLTNWTETLVDNGAGTPAINRDDTNEHGGTYCADLTVIGCAATSYAQIAQTFTGWNNIIRKARLRLSIWCKCVNGTGVDQYSLILDDGVDATTIRPTVNGNWNENILTHTCNAAATGLTLTIKVTSLAGTEQMYVDDIAWGKTNGAVYAIGFNDELYCTDGSMLYKFDSTNGNAFYIKGMFPQTIPYLCVGTVAGADYLFITQGWADEYFYMSAAEAFTESVAADATAKHFAMVGTTFYESDTNSTLRTTTNPLNGGVAWGAQIQVGDDYNDIQDLIGYGGLCYAKKEDKPYYRDSAGNIQVLTDMTVGMAANTARMTVWNGKLYMPYGAQGLLEYDEPNDLLTWRNPASYSTGLSAFTGDIQGCAGDDFYLYTAVDGGSTIETMAGIMENVDGTTAWRWHSLVSTTLGDLSHVYISSVYKKRLWYGVAAGSAINYIPLTTQYGSITSDTNYSFTTGGTFYTPWLHAGFSSEKKAWIKLTLKMSGTTANVYWQAHYKKLGDADWTEINSTAKFKTSPATSAYIPVDGASANPTSEYFMLKFTGVTNATSSTPILLGYDLRAIWYPTERKLISCRVKVEDMIPNFQGMIDDQKGSTILSTLDGINSSSYPRAFYPPYWKSSSDTIYVRKLSLPDNRPQLQLVRIDPNREAEYVYDLLLQVVTIS